MDILDLSMDILSIINPMPRLPPTSRQVAASRYVTLHQEVRRQRELTVACAGRESCQADYHIKRDSFPCHAVEFIIKGAGELIINGHSYRLGPGMLFSYGPGVAYEMRSDARQPLLKYFVDFFGSEASEVLKQGAISPGRIVQILEIENYGHLFEQILTEGAAHTETAAKICASYLRIIILKAADAVRSSTPLSTSSSEKFTRCREYIDEHYLRLRSAEEVAAELHLRPAQLCRLFQQFNHSSPFQYLTHKKMMRAVELLVAERMSVKQTALELGYEDQYHFSRLFKHRFGHSPQNFARLSWREMPA